MPKVGAGHWFDSSVVRDMARKLRDAGLWENSLGDGVAILRDKIKSLERFSLPEPKPEIRIKRPLSTWADCRAVLLSLTRSRSVTFTDIPTPLSCCLSLAVLLHVWEREGVPVPKDIRGMMHGPIAIEWSKSSVILDSEGLFGNVPKSKEQ